MNDLSFLLLELYWAGLIEAILVDPNDKKALMNLIAAVPADRLDGNPILQIIDRSKSPPRQLRIIQKFNSSNAPALDLAKIAPVRYTTEVYVPYSPSLTYEGVDDDGETPIEELVVFSDVSESCERLSRQFITTWRVERLPVTSMHAVIARYWKLIQANLIEVPEDEVPILRCSLAAAVYWR